jgi:UDP-4-amino-4,6-dideoxy-N-acetyl-beta-L-altrosamine transaminase
MIPYGRQLIEAEDIKAVTRALQSAWLTQGPEIEAFENDLAEFIGARHVVAVSSGTAALHLAALAADLGPGDTLVTTPITFVASANCALYCGADVGLVDVDPETVTIDLEALKRALKGEEGRGKSVKAVVPVDFTGHPAAQEEIATIARDHGAVVIDDACHALGAEWRDAAGKWHRVGDGTSADMTIFSFHPVKHITTGEGGAIATNRDDLAAKLRMLRTHGITKDPSRLSRKDGPWYYEMQALGFNYRITDIQCALGRAQLTRLEDWLARRREIARKYDEAFSAMDGVRPLATRAWARSAYHLYVVRIDQDKVPGGRARVFASLQEQGFGVQVHYIPVHYQPYYVERFGFRPGMFPQAERYYEEAISLPMYAALSDAEVDSVVDAVAAAIKTKERVSV